ERDAAGMRGLPPRDRARHELRQAPRNVARRAQASVRLDVAELERDGGSLDAHGDGRRVPRGDRRAQPRDVVAVPVVARILFVALSGCTPTPPAVPPVVAGPAPPVAPPAPVVADAAPATAVAIRVETIDGWVDIVVNGTDDAA